MNPLIHLKKITLPILITVALACFGLLPQATAVIMLPPPPDGCYPNFTTAEGCNALFSLTTGSGNTALGWRSLFLDSTGSFNTGVGGGALALNNADSNTAVGAAALLLNTSGTENVAVGTAALVHNDSGFRNDAIGAFALFNNIDGNGNNAFGDSALLENIHAGNNTAIGFFALQRNDITGNNAAYFNTAVGGATLNLNTDGDSNTAVGYQALSSNTTANHNTAVGFQAGFTQGTGSTGNNNVYIGAGMNGVAGEHDHTYIRNIKDTTVSGAGNDFVTVNLTTGLLGHLSSSRRYKQDIKPMDNSSETLYRLKPVTYRFKKEIDATQSLDYGLVAEEVAQVDPNLAIRDGKGQIESVRYSAINAMLLNEFLKAHGKLQEQEATIARLTSTDAKQEATIAKQQKQIESLTAGLHKVSAQLEASKSAPQVVNNP